MNSTDGELELIGAGVAVKDLGDLCTADAFDHFCLLIQAAKCSLGLVNVSDGC